MKIQEAKDLFIDLYVKSLKIATPNNEVHPLAIIESSKSIIGINQDKPLEKLIG